MTKIYRPVLLNVPNAMLDQLDSAAYALGMTRSALIRRSLTRDLEFITNYEVARAQSIAEDITNGYRNWAAEHDHST